jgi:hypothetical protein
MTTRRSALSVIAALLFCLPGSRPAKAVTEVDLELVLAVDVSFSMDLDEQRLQRDGYVQALRDPQVIRAIQAGQYGRIAITYFEWAGPETHKVVIPWMVIDSAESAEQAAAALAVAPISRARMTSISSALEAAAELIRSNPFHGTRQVIDVSGDGANNAGPPIVPVRDKLVNEGMIINGLPILLRPGSQWSMFDIADLDDYYNSCVVGGPGSFMIPIKEKDEFSLATRQKLLLEVSNITPQPHVMKAQMRVEKPADYDCLVGEKRMQRNFDMWRP